MIFISGFWKKKLKLSSAFNTWLSKTLRSFIVAVRLNIALGQQMARRITTNSIPYSATNYKENRTFPSSGESETQIVSSLS